MTDQIPPRIHIEINTTQTLVDIIDTDNNVYISEYRRAFFMDECAVKTTNLFYIMTIIMNTDMHNKFIPNSFSTKKRVGFHKR